MNFSLFYTDELRIIPHIFTMHFLPNEQAAAEYYGHCAVFTFEWLCWEMVITIKPEHIHRIGGF